MSNVDLLYLDKIKYIVNNIYIFKIYDIIIFII